MKKKYFFAPRKTENTLKNFSKFARNEVKAVKVVVSAALCDVLTGLRDMSAAPRDMLAAPHNVSAAPHDMLAIQDNHGNPRGLEGGYYT